MTKLTKRLYITVVFTPGFCHVIIGFRLHFVRMSITPTSGYSHVRDTLTFPVDVANGRCGYPRDMLRRCVNSRAGFVVSAC